MLAEENLNINYISDVLVIPFVTANLANTWVKSKPSTVKEEVDINEFVGQIPTIWLSNYLES